MRFCRTTLFLSCSTQIKKNIQNANVKFNNLMSVMFMGVSIFMDHTLGKYYVEIKCIPSQRKMFWVKFIDNIEQLHLTLHIRILLKNNSELARIMSYYV